MKTVKMAKTIPGTLVKKTEVLVVLEMRWFSLFIIHKDQFPEVNDTAFSNGILQDLRTGQDTTKYQEESQNSTSSGDVPMVEVQMRISSRPV